MRTFVLLAAVLIGLAAPARAADDVATAQGVIRSQEQAFGRDDAEAAFSYAAPALQNVFQQPDIFMAMVRGSYAPVYRHKSFEFGEARATDGQIAQRVQIVDDDGVAWEALYTLQQQPDGSLKITGCTLLKAGQAV
jgi:Domain of unknown function (DUF4864)